MRISDWSSDVCSSDLLTTLILPFPCAQLAFYIDLAALAQEAFSDIDQAFRENSDSVPFGPVLALARIPILPAFAGRDADIADLARSEARREGKDVVRTCRYGWSPFR